MALIVEDGSGVLNANSYMSVADLRTRAAFEGFDLTAIVDPALEILLLRATRLINSRSCDFSGSIESSTQKTAWPRTNAKFENRVEIGQDEIPDQILQATAFLVNFQADGGEFYSQAQSVLDRSTYTSEETLGPLSIKTEHFPVGHAANQAALGLDAGQVIPIPELEAILKPLFKDTCSTDEASPRFPVCRV